MLQHRFFRVEGERAWLNQLIRRQSVIDERQERCERAIERLHAASLGSGHVNAAMHAQTVAAIFLILAGHDEHPLAGCAAFIPAASPLVGDHSNSHVVPVLKPSILKRDKQEAVRNLGRAGTAPSTVLRCWLEKADALARRLADIRVWTTA
eukprot:4725252-Pleurochrysis_carterae.AAC.1